MREFLSNLSDWSEVWALLIPFVFILKARSYPKYMLPVKWYVFIVLPVNLLAILIQKYKLEVGLEPGDLLYSNNFLYNTHSVLRLLFFSWFFILMAQGWMRKFKILITVLFFIFLLFNFIFLEDYFHQTILSGRLLSVETGILLMYCLLYYFNLLKEEQGPDKRPASFWVVTGLSIYVVINFPIFLFYTSFVEQFEDFAIGIWDVTNISFTIFCILIAKAFRE